MQTLLPLLVMFIVNALDVPTRMGEMRRITKESHPLWYRGRDVAYLMKREALAILKDYNFTLPGHASQYSFDLHEFLLQV